MCLCYSHQVHVLLLVMLEVLSIEEFAAAARCKCVFSLLELEVIRGVSGPLVIKYVYLLVLQGWILGMGGGICIHIFYEGLVEGKGWLRWGGHLGWGFTLLYLP